MVSQFRILNFLIICYFLLRFELVNSLIPSIWFGFLLLITFFSFKVFFSMSAPEYKFLLKKNIWILISLIVLLTYYFFDYGNFRLEYMINYLVTSIPFLIIGYYYSIKNKDLNYIILSVFSLSFLIYLPVVVQYLFSGNYSREFLKSLIFLGKENSGLIHFWPFLTTLIIFSIIISRSFFLKLNSRIVIYASALLLITFLLFSGYFSAIFFIIIYLLSSYFNKVNFLNFIKKFVIYSFTIYLFVFAASKFLIGTISEKSKAIYSIVSSGLIFDETLFNLATSNRFSAGIYSVLQFIEKPLYGHGVFLEESLNNLQLIESYSSASGGHSFFLDLLAFMGVFSIPIFLIYLYFIKHAKKLSNLSFDTSYYKYYLSIYSILVAIFISNIANSWLLFSSFDNFIFLIGGYICGKLYLLNNPNKSMVI
jgi:hypothetical protein